MATTDKSTKSEKSQKGSINVTTENIFPIIKKFLYSDHEIFLRELVSNAADATMKRQTISKSGDVTAFKGDTPQVFVKLDKDAKTITISDNGIGMSAEEIDKYINQIAFSGATEFLDKYKEDDAKQAIIGHFGLGFYSSFMVSERVDIISKSAKKGSKAVTWSLQAIHEDLHVKYTRERIIRSDLREKHLVVSATERSIQVSTIYNWRCSTWEPRVEP